MSSIELPFITFFFAISGFWNTFTLSHTCITTYLTFLSDLSMLSIERFVAFKDIGMDENYHIMGE